MTQLIERKEITQYDEQLADFKISTLINSAYYFLESVFIMETGNMFRLLVFQKNIVLCDKTLSTMRGAKVSFSKIFHTRCCSNGIAPEWSILYFPNKASVQEQINLADHAAWVYENKKAS